MIRASKLKYWVWSFKLESAVFGLASSIAISPSDWGLSFAATSEPKLVKIANAAIKGFALTHITCFVLVNRTVQPLEVDWTQSRYLADGQPQGTFVFEGLTAKTVRSPPMETVSAGQTLSKLIWPLQLLGWVPIKDKSLDADTPGFSPGVLPEGENGMLLVIGQDSNWKRYSLQVSLSSRMP